MDKELKDLLDAQAKAVHELRAAQDSNIKLSDEKLVSLQEAFTKGEEANKKVAERLDAQDKAATEQAEVIKTLETKAYRMAGGQIDSEAKAVIKSFEDYMMYPTKGEVFVGSDMDRKYLRTDIAADGGVLVPEILSSELLKQEIEISPIMANATVKNSTVKSLDVAIRTTIPTVNRPGEGGTSIESNSQFKKVRLEAYRNDVVIPITREELNFAAFDMRTQMSEDAAIALTQQTNIDFLSGDGVSKSLGILTDTSVSSINSGIANDINLDNFLEIQKKDNIKGLYRQNGKFYMNANTIYDLAQRKDGTGDYLWQQNIAAGIPNQIAGRAYVDTPDMDDIGAGNVPVFFGDLRKGYQILRAVGVELIIDIYSSKKQGIIEYMWVEFIGGKVVLAEAIVKLTCAV
ncbi:phage major capsid protein [Candidatus Pacearchaeota archaeon]|nr:phage major capsid protein [Candidatus Pacearchaeota archaeon]